MVSLADSLVASSARPLGLRMRADLTARRQRYLGRSYWVVKEPVGLRYFRFQDEEFAVLNMLKGGVSLQDIKERFEKEFAPHKITYQDLQHFIGTLHRSGLVVSDAPGQGQQLKKRGDERRRKELLAKLSNILAIRFKGIDPDRLLNWLYPLTRWLFHPVTVLGVAVLAMSALLLITVQFDVFRSRLPGFEQFFGPKNWAYLAIVLGVTKILHEFGHGLLCKHYGGECHEMGVMFLVLTPCLYCNVSDSWMLPNKWHRAAIGAGGMYIELILASIATFAWWFSDPGLLNHLALRVMFICSISTVLFNGNPLLRFDGYYILADLIEIPNLRQKSTRILQRYAAQWCLGLEMPEDPFLPQRNQFLFALYTIAAVAYRWFIFFSILYFLNKVFEPYGLQIIGRAIAIMGLFGLVIQPLYVTGKFLHVPGRMDQVKWPRFYATLAIFASLIAVVLFCPFPRYVKCPLQIEPCEAATVYVSMPGRLAEIFARPGDHVQPGDRLVELENLALLAEVGALRNEKSDYEAQLKTLQATRSSDPEADAQIKQVAAMVQAKSEQLEEREADLAKLHVIAPVSGTVFAPPLRFERPTMEGELPKWTGLPFDPVNHGAFLEGGDVVCRVGDPRKVEAILAIDQADIDFVKEQQEVKIVLDAATDLRFEGKITVISKRNMQVAPPGVGNQAGGGLPTRTDSAGVERPASATYQATVPLDNEEGLIKIGYRGRAKIRAGYQTIWSRLWRYLMRTFHFYI
jgi:putative peptide zinc metalloprotease protein